MTVPERLRELDSTERTFDAGARLFRHGDEVSVLHVVEDGEAHLVRHHADGGALVLQRALANKVWALNGLAESPREPFFAVCRGETVLLEMVNDTAWPHGMHLHGHHFRHVSPDGSLGPWRDTLLVDREETVRIAFLADNPGDWLLHCHMLEHSVSGMLTWFQLS